MRDTPVNGSSQGHSVRGGTGASRGTGRYRGRGRGRGRASGQRGMRITQIPWQEIDPNTDEVTPIFPFAEPVGPSHTLPEGSTPFEFYSQIVDRSVVEILVTETNK